MKLRIFLIVFMIGFVNVFISEDVKGQGLEIQLIEHATVQRHDVSEALHFYGYKDVVTRFREVSLYENIKSPNSIAVEDLIVLNLFGDSEYTAEVHKVENLMEDNVTITAKLLSSDYAYMIISTTEGRSLVTIRVHELGRIYQIIRDPSGLNYYLIQLDLKKMTAEDELPAQVPPAPTLYDIEEQKRIEQELENKSTGPWDPATIDVMMVYTHAARTWGNNNGGIRNLVATAIADGNVILSNSNTVASFRLVHNAEVNYTESPSLRVDLRRLTTSPTFQPWGSSWTWDGVAYNMLGFMDDVHTWRNTFGADLVLLFTATGSGIGWVLNTSAGLPNYGFSISNIGRLWDYTPTHEKGHNMGCGHHKQQNVEPGPELYTYSAGWRWQASGTWYSSVMAYKGGGYYDPPAPGAGITSTVVPYFSNPSINHLGVATGHAADGDNARTIRNTKHVVAAYRSTASINCIACPGYNFTIAPGNSWLTHSSSIVSGGCKIYRVAVEKGRTYTFKTGCGNGATANFDTYLEILNENCALDAMNDDGCEDFRSIITWMATYTGYAYVKVTGWGGHSGTYTMAYQRTDDLTWTGQINTSWHLALNWNGGVVPDNTFNVIIPGGTARQPSITAAHAYCKSLTINTGGTLTVGGYTLYVNNDLTIGGTLAMNNSSGVINAYGDVAWNSGSTAGFSASSVFWVYGNWTFQSGSNANLANGVVAFAGSSDKFITNHSSGSSFNNISSYKTTGKIVGISYSSSQALTIKGNIYVHPNATFGIYSLHNIILKGDVNSNSDFHCNFGTVVLNGVNQSLRMNTGNYFNNLTFNQSGTVTINNSLSNILDVRGNVVISSGVFNMQDRVVRVGGNWTNNAFPAGFNAGTGRVIFNRASGHQHIYSSENFNILEVDMNAAVRVINAAHTVTCNQYDWTKGGIDVVAGTFTALDLAQNGIFGGYWLNPGGVINLTQDNSGWVDLNGSLNIFGGVFNVYGGSSQSYWPWAADATINMSGGVLDFKDQGINIYNSAIYSLTENITGGTIRTSKGFSGNRADFAPSAGTFEFYGSSDFFISQSNGSTLHHVKTNKSAKDGGEDGIKGLVYDERTGELLSDGGKANTITLGSNFTITGNLNINSGTFNLGAYSCSVNSTTNIYGALSMTNAANDLTAYRINWQSGSDANVTAGTFHTQEWMFYEGTNAMLGTGNTAYVYALYYPTDDDAEFGNLVAVPSSKVLAGDDGSKAFHPVRIAGNFTLQNTSWSFHTSGVDVIVQGNADIQNGGSLYFSQGNDFIVNGTLNLAGSLFLSVGSVATIAGGLTFPSTGWLSLNSASFFNNYDVVSGLTTLNGKLTMNAGSMVAFPGRSISLGVAFVNQISGGTLQFGRTFSATTAGTFQQNSGTIEFVSSNTGHYLQLSNGNFANNVVINKPSGSLLVHDDLTLKGNLTIDAGVLNSNNKTIQVAGDWTNNVGTAAFTEGTGRVIFNGAGNQTCSSETFHTLEVNKTSGAMNFPGTTVCATYDWTAGGIAVNGGTFTANDLADNGLFGSYTVSNGTINLHQDEEQYIDFAGDITIGTNGVLNIYGGNSRSWWPYFSDASLTMSGNAILDIKDNGIYVYDTETWSFTANITGGTIRTSGGFQGDRADFTPTAGTFEFYGSTDFYLSQSNGSTLHNVNINKSSKHVDDKTTPVATHCKRDGTLLSDGGKSNTISLASDFTVTNNVNIYSGSLELFGKTLNVESRMNVYGTLIMNDENDLLNIGQSYYDWLWFYGGSNANLTHGTVYCKGWVVPGTGSQFDLGINNTIYFTGPTGGGLSSYEPTASYGNVVFSKDSGHSGYFDGLATQPAHVKGTFNIAPNNTFAIQYNSLTIDGSCDWDPTSYVYLGYSTGKETEGNYFTGAGQSLPGSKTTGYLELNAGFDLKGFVDVALGNMLLTNIFGIANTGILTINGGSLINNRPYDIVWTDIYGTLNMTDGLFELTYNHPQFYASATTNISGGIIRTGGAFAAVEAPVFQPVGGTVEITGNQSANAIYCYGGNFFHNLLINRSDLHSKFMFGEPVSIQNNFVVENGEMRTGPSAVSVSGNTSVKADGKLVINSGASLLIAGNKSLTINSSGILDVSGALGNQAVISSISKSHYAFNVESGATIGAEHGIFEYMDVNGINIKPGAFVEHARAFTNCTFRNGESGGSLLTINNDQVFTVHHAGFPANTWGGLYNVSKTENSGQVEFKYYTGDFAGSGFENDVHNRIDWFEPLLTADPLIRNVTPPAGTTTFDVISNLTWTVTESVSWLEVSHTWGSNNETITVTYDANPSPDARIGHITLSADYAPDVTLTVIQSGVSLAVFPPSRDVGAAAGTTSFLVSTNTGWTVSESVPWLSVVPMSGSGIAELIVTYDANTGNTPRSGNITVSAAGAPDVIVSVNQAGSGEIPVNLLVENETVNNGDSECFDALQTITVQNFVVESGGEANLIAGESIMMLAGTHAKAGSYLHARITTTGDFCGSTKSMLAAEDLDKGATHEEMPMPVQLPGFEKNRALFRVFPNPTTGMFTLEFAEAPAYQACSMEIYTLVGERVMSEQLLGNAQHQFDLTFRPKGIYIVRMTVGDQVGIEKLVKH